MLSGRTLAGWSPAFLILLNKKPNRSWSWARIFHFPWADNCLIKCFNDLVMAFRKGIEMRIILLDFALRKPIHFRLFNKGHRFEFNFNKYYKNIGPQVASSATRTPGMTRPKKVTLIDWEDVTSFWLVHRVGSNTQLNYYVRPISFSLLVLWKLLRVLL